MSDDLVGTLMDAGMSPQDARELLGPAYATTHDPGAPIEPVVHTLLTVARDEREPPGPQVAVPSGVIHSLPDSKAAKVVRVDTEDTYRKFRGRNGVDMQTLDAPENSESVPDMLNQLAQTEAGLSDTVDFQRGYASQWITGHGGGHGGGGHGGGHRGRGGGGFGRGGGVFVDYPVMLSDDQVCLFCGTQNSGSPVCARCAMRAQHVIGLFERGAASAIYDRNPGARHIRATTLGYDFYRMQRTNEESARLIGTDEFYRLQHQLEESAVLGSDAEEFYRLQRTNEESATLIGAEEFYRLQHQLDETPPVVGDDFYRLQHQVDETATLVGADDPFYRLQWQTEESATLVGADMYSLDRFVEEARALSATSDAPAEAIPLSFTQPDANEHVASWKQGDNLYASVRVAGWDGRPRILTMATPFSESISAVVGYAQSARIPPSQTLAVLDPLARTLGASKLVPRLAASAPSVLRVAHEKLTPLVMATMPVTNHRVR